MNGRVAVSARRRADSMLFNRIEMRKPDAPYHRISAYERHYDRTEPLFEMNVCAVTIDGIGQLEVDDIDHEAVVTIGGEGSPIDMRFTSAMDEDRPMAVIEPRTDTGPDATIGIEQI